MDQSKIWDHFQNNHMMQDAFAGAFPRYEFIADRTYPGMKVLNIGVGRGGLEGLLIRKGVEVSCLDPSEVSIENIRLLHKLGDKAKVGFSQSIPFPDNEFDVVVMSEVLEHLSDDVLVLTLREVWRVIKPDGRFLATVPANENLFDGHTVCPNCAETFHRWGHLQSFSKDRIAALLIKSNFKISTIHIRSFPNWRRRGFINFFKSLVRYLLGRMGSPISNPIIYFEAKKY